MKLFEDERINKMEESMELFQEIVNSKWFTKTGIILILNNSDLFREKLEDKRVDLRVLFPDYNGNLLFKFEAITNYIKGGFNFDAATKFIQDKFLSLSRNCNRKIYSCVTCATDTQTVHVVFDAAKEIIIQTNLER